MKSENRKLWIFRETSKNKQIHQKMKFWIFWETSKDKQIHQKF